MAMRKFMSVKTVANDKTSSPILNVGDIELQEYQNLPNVS